MSHVQPELIEHAPFAGLPAVPAEDCGLIVRERNELGLATILARKDKSAWLARRIREHFGLELPQGARRTQSSDLALVGMGPGAWLAIREGAANELAKSLQESIGELASISEQSDGYAVLRLSGPKVRDALCKLVPVDLHPRAFRVGDAACTVAAHIGVTMWRLDDDTDGSPVFELALFRSFAASFWHALYVSAAEFGFERRAQGFS
jgi:methylglutamate dehydrogenase subunit D